MSDDTKGSACAICGANVATRWLELARDYVTGQFFSVWRYGVCDVAFTTPSPAALDQHYVPQYRRYNAVTASVLHWLYERRADAWARVLGKPGIVLEIGCGQGWMLAALRRKGWRVVGTERTLTAVRPARGERALPVFVGTLDALRKGQRFDVIVLFQVLEHLAAPIPLLTTCASLLKPGDTIIVGVPNARSWQARLFGADWLHLDVPRHRFHYSPQALSWALKAVGLRPGSPTFASFEHDPYGWAQSLLNRLGFAQNSLTMAMMEPEIVSRARARFFAMFGVATLVAVPSVLVAMCSWVASAGAVMEMRGKKPH